MVESIIYQLKPVWEKVYTTVEDHDIKDANSVKRYLRGVFDERPEQEHIVVLHIDTNMNIKGREVVAIGNLVSVGAGVREIFRSAVTAGSFGIVLVHNHPSTDLRPSDPDITFTKALIMSGKIIGIPVFEHYICDSNLEHKPTKISELHPALWALSPIFVDDKTMLDDFGLVDPDKIDLMQSKSKTNDKPIEKVVDTNSGSDVSNFIKEFEGKEDLI